jgi:hypothetical protein
MKALYEKVQTANPRAKIPDAGFLTTQTDITQKEIA